MIDLKAIAERASRLLELAAKATPGEWWVLDASRPTDGYSDGEFQILIGDQEDRVCEIHVGECEGKEADNAAFIAAARTDVPQAAADIDALILKVRQQEVEIAALRGEVSGLQAGVERLHAQGGERR